MSYLRRQAGEGKLGFLFWMLVLGMLLLAGFRVIPVKIATAQLKDHMEELAQLSPRGDSRYFSREIYNRARELDLPVEKKNIKVDKRPNRVIMDVDMKVPVDLLVTTYDWQIKIHVDRDLFLM